MLSHEPSKIKKMLSLKDKKISAKGQEGRAARIENGKWIMENDRKGEVSPSLQPRKPLQVPKGLRV
ncbi:MAG: hypothetical protein LBT00_05085, partial [Spirochaetaceae bacterium]|nr:hypothetical protein [Spirochaetaceae bacterium]